MASYTAGDIVSVALDVTNGNIYMSKNGGANDSTWADGSGNNNQSTESTGSFTIDTSNGSGDSTLSDLQYKNSG